jgi:FkbM family methyltransferase
MNRSLKILANLWWGPFRPPFEKVSRLLWANRQAIQFGPLRGAYFQGGLAQLIGIYEFHVQQVLSEHLSQGDIFYDVGANNGYLSLLASRLVGKGGKVFAFEPFPDNISAIQRVIQQNALSNCHLIPQAVADKSDTMTLYVDRSGNAATPSLMGGSDANTHLIQTTTLDDFIDSYPIPRFVKMDIEGAEALALRGAERLIAQASSLTWLIEIHSAEADNVVKEIFNTFAYRFKEVDSLKKRSKMYPYHLLSWK